jgi:exonuclease SbcC
MRPSRLVLENFGPYRERAEIDFSKLGPLFLVCGKTGSGKTSIFDAMTYALYGQAPGARGGLERQLWSQHAAPGDVPLVEFEFFLAGGEYRAVRNPPYRRARLRGKKDLIEVDSSAAFYRRDVDGPGWKLLADKKSEVDEAIRDLVGLTEDEFSKIILLPQGEFQRFLDMKSSDRVEVLEKLFPVSMHEAVSALAKEKTRDALAAVRRVDAELERLGGPAASEAAERERGELEAEAARLASERDRAAERLHSAELALSRAREAAEREARTQAARERLAALEAEAPAAAAREKRIASARAAARAAPALAARESAAADLASARASLEEQRSRLEGLASREGEMKEGAAEARRLAEEAAAADRELGELRAAQAAWDESLMLRSQLEASRARSAELAALAESARADEARLQSMRGAAAGDADEDDRTRSDFEAARTAQEAAGREAEAAAAALELARKAARLAAAALEAGKRAEDASRRRAEADAAFAELAAEELSCRAAALASELRPGEACPVCGSREHPKPANAPAGSTAFSGKALDEARAGREAVLAEESEARAAAKSSSERAVEAERELFGPEAGGGSSPVDVEGFSERLEEARSRAKQASEILAASAARVREMEERRKQSARIDIALDAARKKRSEDEAAAQRAAIETAKLETRLEAAVKGAGVEDPGPRADSVSERRERALAERGRVEEAVAAWEADRGRTSALVAELAGRVASLGGRLAIAERDESAALAVAGFADAESALAASLGLSELASLEARAAAYRSGLDAARATAAALEAELAASSRTNADSASDEEALAAAARAAREERDERQAALDAAAARAAELAREAGERSRLVSERSRLDAEWSRLNGLSALLCGELPGRKLPFKNYALGAYFRVVAERASARLSRMSDGRYALAADEGEGRGYLGLELLVRDAHTGQSRPAGTLSGGERFMAALCLAFGLADTIRERSGGSSLDAIFIDEGFGSLDDEALDRAVSVLDEARGARTVGIVSHVAELKSRIPSRIEVAKGRSGSSLRVFP